MSVLVGGCLLLADLILIVMILASPKVMGISEDDVLSRGQRGFLGSLTLVTLIEGVVIATCDWCKYFYLHFVTTQHLYNLKYYTIPFPSLLLYNIIQIEKDLIPRKKRREKR